MNPRDLLEIISRSPEKRSSQWDAAFVLYNLNHDKKDKVRSGCGKCYGKVKTWLAEHVN